MTLRVLPDVEMAALRWLKAQAELTALVGQRIYAKLPKAPTFPAVRLMRVGGTPVIAQHLDVARLQVEAFAPAKYDAWRVAATAQAAIHLLPGIHFEGVVTAVEDAVGLTWAPDNQTDRPRYLFDVLVYAHPHPDWFDESSLSE